MGNLQNPRLRKIGETLIAGVVTSAFIICLFTVPYLNAIVLFTVPMAIVYIGVKNGLPYGLAVTLLSGLLASIILGPVIAICTIEYYGVMGMALAAFIYNKRPAYFTLACTIVFTMMGALLLMWYIQTVSGMTLMDIMDKGISQYTEMAKELYGAVENTGMTIDQFTSYIEEVGVILKQGLPSMVIIMSTLIVYFNQRMVTIALNKQNIYVRTVPPLKDFSLPRNAIIGSALIYGMAYLIGTMEIIDMGLILTNLQRLFMFAFVVQGLAASLYLMSQRKINLPVKALLIFVLLFFVAGRYVLFMIGLFDICFDTRKRFRA